MSRLAQSATGEEVWCAVIDREREASPDLVLLTIACVAAAGGCQ